MNKAILVALMIGMLACSPGEQATTLYDIDVEAVDDRGDPVPTIVVSIGETRIGSTDEGGHLRARLAARDGQRFDFHAMCPKRYSSAEIPTEVVFHNTHGLGGKKNASLNFRIRCIRNDRVVALLVHAGGHGGMPVLIDGVAVATTDSKGFAHVRLDLKPNTQFEVSLDSSTSPLLLPANPRQSMTLGSEDGLFVFDPTFRVSPPPVKKRRRRRHRKTAETPRSRPVRID